MLCNQPPKFGRHATFITQTGLCEKKEIQGTRSGYNFQFIKFEGGDAGRRSSGGVAKAGPMTGWERDGVL